MGFYLPSFFKSRRNEIITRWVDLLKTEVGEQYAARSRQELMGTVSKAYDAEVDVILSDNYDRINAFITDITKMRLEAGFLLSDVQKAFELFRKLALDLLIEETTLAEFSDSVARMNDCLNYTIHRFSDYFQAMHEKKILEHNRLLEAEIQSKVAKYDKSVSRIGICRDITNRVRMEKKVRENERLAYIGQITTSLSHEIRNPLSAIKMNLQILKKNPRIMGNDQRRIDISAKEVNRLERILEEVLDFAKPLQIKISRVDINAIVLSSLDLLDMKYAESGIAIVTDLGSNLPIIQADGEKLGQALINILLNALEASSYGSKVEIQTTVGSGIGDEVEIILADEGHGISRQHVSEIFKPFFTTKSSGTGLGLSNAHRIIEAHGGRIDVENRPIPGAYFKIILPVECLTKGTHG